VVLAESKLAQVAGHILLADMNVRAADRCLKELPEAFDVVHVVRHVLLLIVVGVFLRAVLHGPVRVAITGQ
jgi:hypothetical protein